MEKKVMIVIGLMILLGSCGELRYGVEKTIDEAREDREIKEWRKKNAGGAIGNKNYESSVLEVIENISKRPINKHAQFGGITLLIPENTIINQKVGNIVDEKTGYGIPVSFDEVKRCTSIFYRKKVNDQTFIRILYNEKDPKISNISQKIIRTNGFTKTCN